MWRTLRYAYLLLILFVLANCQKKAELSEFVQKFVDEGLKRGISVDLSQIDIQLAKLSNDIPGKCFQPTATNPKRVVLIDEATFQKINDQRRTNLVFHELGHCSLSKDHEAQLGEDGKPQSFMYPSLILPSYLKDDYLNRLTDNLFTNIPEPVTMGTGLPPMPTAPAAPGPSTGETANAFSLLATPSLLTPSASPDPHDINPSLTDDLKPEPSVTASPSPSNSTSEPTPESTPESVLSGLNSSPPPEAEPFNSPTTEPENTEPEPLDTSE